MIVSHVPPSPFSTAIPVLGFFSSLRISRNTFPPGACMANLAGFRDDCPFVVLGFDPEADELVIDIADVGRMNGTGDTPPGFADALGSDEGCCRTANTKVLFNANLSHCGCAT
jgi:hypothetical protein